MVCYLSKGVDCEMGRVRSTLLGPKERELSPLWGQRHDCKKKLWASQKLGTPQGLREINKKRQKKCALGMILLWKEWSRVRGKAHEMVSEPPQSQGR